MAQKPLGYVCRDCRHALKSAKLIKSPPPSSRCFSTSPAHLKALATFTPTQSPELDQVLSRWRNDIFLPSVLSKHHKSLVYKQSRANVLTTPPGVTVTVQTMLPPSAPNAGQAAEEEIQLQPMNAFDAPGRRKSCVTIINELAKTGDAATWDNLIPFLQGAKQARQPPIEDFLARLARKANIRGDGRWNTILNAATRAHRTGVTLADRNLTQELVLGAHDRAAASAFSLTEPRQTFKKILLLLDADEHCGPGQRWDRLSEKTHADMRTDVYVIAAQLSFSASRAVQEYKGKDEDKSVAADVEKLLAALSLNNPSQISNEDIDGRRGGDEDLLNIIKARKLLERDAIILCALGLAKKVDMQQSLGRQRNVEVSVALEKELEKVQKRIAESRAVVASLPEGGRGLAMLRNVEQALEKH